MLQTNMSAATQKITYYYTPAALIMAERNPSKHTLYLQEHKLQPVCDVANLRAGEVTFLVLPLLNSDDFMDEKQEIKLLLPNGHPHSLVNKGWAVDTKQDVYFEGPKGWPWSYM